MKSKMNGLYKAGFIILLCCIPMFFAALATAYLFEQVYMSAIFSAGGALSALAGIILTLHSKKAKTKIRQKSESTDSNAENAPGQNG